MATEPLRILAIGAHPDDCDIKAGGAAALWKAAGHEVRFVSVTNGEAGHHRMPPEEVAAVRREEAAAAARVLGLRYDVLEFRDGHLLPDLDARIRIIALIREYAPDLILTHRPNDYHPDHRSTSQLVCDAAYLVTVPAVVPDAPALRESPVIAYFSDDFRRPCPFSPTVAVDIEPVIEAVIDMLHCHQSQFYDWLAYNHHYAHTLPPDEAGRRAWLGEWFRQRIADLAGRHRDLLIAIYGSERGGRMRYIEAFEPSEYGNPLTAAVRGRLFPFLSRLET